MKPTESPSQPVSNPLEAEIMDFTRQFVEDYYSMEGIMRRVMPPTLITDPSGGPDSPLPL